MRVAGRTQQQGVLLRNLAIEGGDLVRNMISGALSLVAKGGESVVNLETGQVLWVKESADLYEIVTDNYEVTTR